MPTTAELRTQMLAVVRALDPAVLSGESAAAVVRDLAVIEKAAATGRMFAALRVAQTDAWRGHGHASAADWLAAQAGITVREAASQLGTAKKAEQLPKTKAAMRKGDLSPEQAEAVTGAAAADPGAEDTLLDSARNDTTAQLRDKAAKAKAAATDAATRERRIHATRSLRTRTDADGAFCLTLRGPAIDGVRLQALLRPFEEQAFRTGRTHSIRDTFENRSYDAFYALLAHLQHQTPTPAGTAASPAAPPNPPPPNPTGSRAGEQVGTEPASGDPVSTPVTSPTAPPATDTTPPAATAPGKPGEPPPPASPSAPTRPPGGNNIKVIVRIDHTALARGHTIAGETCEVAGLGPISVTTAQALMADAFLAAVITKGKDVLNVAHLGRGLNAHQRTAIEALGLRCSNRACNKTIALQIDHRTPYAHNPETRLDNQDPLCPDCHRRKTHHGWHLEPGHGPRQFLPPDAGPSGGRHQQTPPAGGHHAGERSDPSDPSQTTRASTEAHTEAGGPGGPAREGQPSLL